MNKISFDFGAQSCHSIEQVAEYINNSSDLRGFEQNTPEFLAAAYASDCCEYDSIEEAEAHLEFLAGAGAKFDTHKALALLS